MNNYELTLVCGRPLCHTPVVGLDNPYREIIPEKYIQKIDFA
jgi:hypothetical protein